MRSLWRPLTKALQSVPPQYRQHARFIADLRPFREGDHVVLRSTKDRTTSPICCWSLQRGSKLDTHKGIVFHDDILGKRVRDSVQAKRRDGRDARFEYRLHAIKLEEYVRWTKRLVTPLYPQDAQLIVGLLDLHVEPPRWGESPKDEPKMEILEAGTGHGALTLYLSRAIHAANSPFPTSLSEPADEEDHAALEAWKATRRAIIHTIEIQRPFAAHARKTVQNFRNGIYAPNVDFHVGSVSHWATNALEQRGGEPFLSHAFLDLPNADHHIDAVAAALRTDGTLIVFNPSITQIMDAVAKIRSEKSPLELENVIELGVNGGSGGREWDVRSVRPRATMAKASTVQQEAEGASVSPEVGAEDSAVELESRDAEQTATLSIPDAAVPEVEQKEEWKMVCRPKVGDRISGGGFLAVFRKQRRRDRTVEASDEQHLC